ncbi:unnamed protein product [Gongylonema pulchrum]|uniref:Retrotransposon protein n=1 Tax=Gongylonema pulchrum TaxID=637853 RepID=A0A183D6L5_9BILA|nr:unnamed protein product [Gongylonema pulchrum]
MKRWSVSEGPGIEGNGNFFGEQQSPRQLLAPTAEPEGQPRQFIEMDVQGAVNYNRVANIFGHEMAKMICSRHPAMASSKTVLNKLADFILNEHMGNRDSQPASNSQSVSQILEEYKDNGSTAIHIVANGSQTTAGTNSVIESELIRIEPDLIPAAMNLEDGLTEDTGTGSDTDGEEIDLIQFSDSE